MSFSLAASASATQGSATINATATAQATTPVQHDYTLSLAVTPPLPVPGRTSYILSGETPESIVYDRTHKLLYACIPALNQVLVINPATHQTVKTLSVPAAGQSDLSPDGTEIVVGSDVLAQLTFIDTATQSISRVIPLATNEGGLSYFSGTMGRSAFSPVFLAGGDVLFLSGFLDSDPSNYGPLFRWSATTNTVAYATGKLAVSGTLLNRTPDGSKVLVTGSGTQIYNAASDSITAQNTTFTVFAVADPVNPRFFVYDTNGFQILDTGLNQLALLPFSTTTASMPYTAIFSLDGSMLFVAESGVFSGLFAYQTVNTENYTLGSMAPLMSFYGNDEVLNDVNSEVPLAIDETNLIYGQGNRGIAIDNPLNYYSTAKPALGRGFEFFTPSYGSVGVSTATMPHNLYATDTGVYFFTSTANDVPSGTVIEGGYSTISTPAITTPGPASIEMVEPDNSFSFYPAAFTFGVQAIAAQPAAGPAGGGIAADVIAYGVGGGKSTVSVSVNGVPASVTAVSAVGGLLPNPLPIYDVSFTVPPGIANSTADVSVTASGYTSTLKGAFTYEQQISDYPFPSGGTPNSILFDAKRQLVYLLTSTQVDVFSLSSHSYLSAIIPPTLNGKFLLAGFDLSIDGSSLAITNLGDQSVAIVNPDAPSTSPKLFPLVDNFGGYGGGPSAIAATSKGTFFVGTDVPGISGPCGSLYELNPANGSLVMQNNLGVIGLNCAGFRLMRSADGTEVFLNSPNSTGGPLVMWSAATGSFTGVGTAGFVDDGAISPDGSTVSYFFEPDGGSYYENVLDSNFNTLSNVIAPEGLSSGFLFGQFLNASGALLYIPVANGIDVYDVHSGNLRKRIGVVESPNDNIYQAATTDNTGTLLFLLTLTGLDVIEDTPPLSVRSATPIPSTVGAGTVITLRGADFQPGAAVTIGGQTVPATVTDAQTLTFALPSMVATYDFTVTNPDGTTYTY
jgi:hypothetical protein